MVCARARFLARPRYLTLAKPHSCLTTRKACSPRARVRERARLIIRQRSLKGRWEVGAGYQTGPKGFVNHPIVIEYQGVQPAFGTRMAPIWHWPRQRVAVS